MSWFQLDAESIVERVRSDPDPDPAPTMGASITRGIIGFTVVSVAGFAPWAVFGRALSRSLGEAGMYAVCAVVFMGGAGLLMHRLMIGPGSLARFYKLFGVSFAAYSVAWTAGWMALRGHPGSVVGLLAGTAFMGWMMATAFDSKRDALKIIAALFVLNAAGYFGGGILRDYFAHLKGLSMPRGNQNMIANLLWGASYGIGFGAGLGLAFYLCQAKARVLLKSSAP